MLVLLNRHQWNISRVARALGTTRRTVYLRMQRYSIPRQKIPKLLKPLPGMEMA
jgi:DNA-binding NtrC family response regulator